MKRKIILLTFIVMAFVLLCFTAYAAVTGQMLGSTIKGDAVDGAMEYELYLLDEYGYALVDSSPDLNFDLSGYGIGEYVFAVRAKGVGYLPSDFSNEVIYTVSGGDETVYYSVTYNPDDHGQISSSGGFTVAHGGVYWGTILPYEGYSLPSEIYVTMGGTALTSGYTYDSTTGEFMIDNVTGNLYITYDAPSNVSSAPSLRLNGSVVSWNAISGANDYHIRVMSIDTQTSYDQYFKTPTTSFDLSAIGLPEAGNYHVAVWADTDAGFGESAAITYNYGG